MTKQADVNRLMAGVRPRVPGALDAAILFELFDVMDEWFSGTNCWYEDIPFICDTTRLAQEYLITPTSGLVTRLVYVKNATGFAQGATMPVPGTLLLNNLPTDGETLTARVYLSVTDPVSTQKGYPEFPDWVLAQYNSDIKNGLLGALMSQIAKPYTSTAGAKFHMGVFRSAISRVKAESQKMNLYGGQAWAFPRSFSMSRRR